MRKCMLCGWTRRNDLVKAGKFKWRCARTRDCAVRAQKGG
jgi:hypothetical protein